MRAVLTSLFLASPGHCLLHFQLDQSASQKLRPHQCLQTLARQERSKGGQLLLGVPPKHEASHLQLSVMSDFLSVAATTLPGNAAERGYWVSAAAKRTQS